MMVGFLYGTYLWIGSSQGTISLFSISMNFRIETALFALVSPIIITWVFGRISTGMSNLKVKSTQTLIRFLSGRRGNVRLEWDDVETATLEKDKVTLNLKDGGFRAGYLKQVYNPVDNDSSLGKSNVATLKEFLSQKLGDRLQVIE